MRSLLAASLLVAGTTVVLGGTAGAQTAEVEAAQCDTTIIGQDVDGRVHKASGTNGVIDESYRTAEPVPWSLRALYSIGGSGGGGSWGTSFLAPATDGDLRVVNLRGTEGDPTMTAGSHHTVETGWNPHVMPAGSGFKMYTIEQDGDILMRAVGPGSDGMTELGDYETLPVTAVDTKAAGVFWIRLADGTQRDVIYATNGETGALHQIIVDPEEPASAESHTLAETGFAAFTHLKAGFCGGESLSVVAVDSEAGNARWFEHADPLSHSGSTLSTGRPVGTDGQWEGWTGIG